MARARGNWDGPLFASVSPSSRKGITSGRIYQIVKKSVASIGLDPKQYGGHSLRSGAVTQALNDGEEVPGIMSLTGHRLVNCAGQLVVGCGGPSIPPYSRKLAWRAVDSCRADGRHGVAREASSQTIIEAFDPLANAM